MNKNLFNPLPQEERYFRILEVHDNWIKGRLLDEYTTGADGSIQHNFQETSTEVIIIKKRGSGSIDSLCRCDWDTKTFDSKTYTWINNDSRDVSGVTEYINPPYNIKDGDGSNLTMIIQAKFNPYGTGFFSNTVGLIHWEETGNRQWIVPSTGGGYNGPFAIVNVSDEDGLAVSIQSEDRQPNMIRLGIDANKIAFSNYNNPAYQQTVEDSGYLYLDIYFVGSERRWHIDVKFGDLPEDTSSHYYHEIGYIEVDSSGETPVISKIEQMQFGNIHLTTRGW